jgi:hypothetical protein
MAKDLVRTRNQIQKFYRLHSHLQAVSLRMQVCFSLYIYLFPRSLALSSLPICLWREVQLLNHCRRCSRFRQWRKQ